MKVNLELDLTPEELRRLFGLPDVSPINDMVVDKLGEQSRRGSTVRWCAISRRR